MFKKIGLVLLSFLMAISTAANNFFNGDIYPYSSVDKVIGAQALMRSQGVTTDSEAWIFSGKSSLSRVSIDDNSVLAQNLSPFDGLEEYGVDHIGGISCYGESIFAALEDSKRWQSPMVAIYDKDSLEFTGRFVLLDTELMFRGCPWVCCDAERGLFYVANSRQTTEIFCYDLESLEFLRSIPLVTELEKIQGAEMYEGYMLAATNDATRAVYKIDLDSGESVKYFDRIMYQPRLIENFGGEGEDITVLPMADGTVIHALDIGALFIDSNLRHYKPIEEN